MVLFFCFFICLDGFIPECHLQVFDSQVACLQFIKLHIHRGGPGHGTSRGPGCVADTSNICRRRFSWRAIKGLLSKRENIGRGRRMRRKGKGEREGRIRRKAVVRKIEGKGPPILVGVSSFISFLLAFLFTDESRIRALRLSPQALIVASGRRGAAKEIRTVAIVLPRGKEIVLVGEIGGVGVSSGRDAGGAGQKVADVGVEGRRGWAVVVQCPAGVRADHGLTVEQGAGGVGRGRGGRGHVKHVALAQLNRRDVLTLTDREKGFGGWQGIEPLLGSGQKNREHTLRGTKTHEEITISTFWDDFRSLPELWSAKHVIAAEIEELCSKLWLCSTTVTNHRSVMGALSLQCVLGTIMRINMVLALSRGVPHWSYNDIQ